MRNTGFKVVLFLCAVIALSTIYPQGTNALSERDLALTDDPFLIESKKEIEERSAKAKLEQQEADEKKSEEAKEPAPKQSVVHTVKSGESLSKIAAQYQTTWKRLFDKNAQIADPNILNIGAAVSVPEPDEQLAERPLPADVSTPQIRTANVRTRTARAAAPQVISGGSSAGNTYAPGYCTWYAKNRRPDLPNRMGNASAWVASAAAHGFATGSAPRVGAIGQQGNHVVYVESVNGDGTVTISEMNYRGVGVVSSRTAPASSFRYIY